MLYTTKASEVQAIEDKLKKGQDVIEAIDDYLIEQGTETMIKTVFTDFVRVYRCGYLLALKATKATGGTNCCDKHE